jgi:hypothetical protein
VPEGAEPSSSSSRNEYSSSTRYDLRCFPRDCRGDEWSNASVSAVQSH